MSLVDMEEEKYFVATGMTFDGGSFVKALGNALHHADTSNTIKIKKAFPEYWEKYLLLGKKFIDVENAGSDL